MSHVSDIRLRIVDLDALDEAADRLGLELQRDKKTYCYWGSYLGDSHDYGEHKPEEMGTCEHALRVKGTTPRNGSQGPWEIAVVKAKDGNGFQLYYDKYGRAGAALSEKVGPDANALRKEYAFSVAQKKAKATLGRKGWTTQREDLIGGGIRLRLRKR